MEKEDNSARRLPGNRLFQVLATIVLTAAFVGFLIGTGEEVEVVAPPPPRPAPPLVEAKREAVTYSEIREKPQGPNREWSGNFQAWMPKPEQTATPLEPEQRRLLVLQSLEARSSHRAFRGAPPVIPHPLVTQDTKSCLVCHASGITMGDQIAPRMSHKYYVNCTQCHAPAGETPIGTSLVVMNRFEGITEPSEGSRAWGGAPPIIPHSTRMRTECLSCHGPNGWPGLKTSHPERQNCMQCHAPSALLDQNILADSGDSESPAPWSVRP